MNGGKAGKLSGADGGKMGNNKSVSRNASDLDKTLIISPIQSIFTKIILDDSNRYITFSIKQ